MNKKRIGVSRKKVAEKAENTVGRDLLCKALFALGVFAMCASLLIPLKTGGTDAVAVMSGAVGDVPVQNTAEFSIFEYIGEAIVSLLESLR